MSADPAFMRAALALAQEQAGKTGDNPAVGCVVVKDGVIIGQGATGDGGRPHAEEIALSIAGAHAHEADVYVTLEPCAQRSTGGRSCTVLLLEAGVARVVIGCADPHPLANGRGMEVLRAAGVSVALGLLEGEARAVNSAFIEKWGKPS
ncbi:MAG: bifunctional diaminohydroxyphosphoribosylaminopyrimidine deaminase/5-amino-6-(5-phosphoribosylamino)uracil reductase RibD [Caulobacterales bacterium]